LLASVDFTGAFLAQLESARACQARALKGLAGTCTDIATRARHSMAESGDESVAIWAASPLSGVIALFVDFVCPTECASEVADSYIGRRDRIGGNE